ncbi:terminase large subunit [Gluconacetobacter johannae DSM 13595]|uniref:Terminase n=2 Tax=Gluconacetobacter johannae TaxID=112140 RepID=A0A7W4J978_9PROT|nr:terminase [Gluconacetobacter johannae]GBQ82316.1 terminase large subunit [Gluconacetobacter johannae DSM 13595]
MMDPDAPLTQQLQDDLVQLAAECSTDPLRFVQSAFPWGEPGTDLASMDGPDAWQADILRAIGQGILSPAQAIQIAIASGHGIGKSALVSWVILWAITTCEDTRGVVTANTAAQLATKTWPELNRWFRVFLWRSWFEVAATAIYSSDPTHAKTWRIDAISWSPDRVESFAGLHNQGKRILVVFDEASAIPDVIWQTTEGALTDDNTDIIWLVAGNPTRNTGRFRDCFGRFKHRWTTRQIDSRTVRITNKEQIQQWVDDYGEDSDFVRIRVRGVFPRAGSAQFIPSDTVEAARMRDAAGRSFDAIVIGVDVARQGSDQTVIYVRKGQDARNWPLLKLRVADLMQIAAKVADTAQQYRCEAVFVDAGGIGAGVVDRLRQLRVPAVFGVQFGGKADRANYASDASRYANKRAEMWGMMREWLKTGAIPDDPELIADLTAPEFGHNARDEIQIEPKDAIRKRIGASPDVADALALTFAYPILPSPHGSPWGAPRVEADYDPFAAA